MERDQAKRIVESLLYMTDHALSAKEISDVIELKSWDEPAVLELISEISAQLAAQGSPLRIVEVAGGFQMATQPEMAPWVRRLYKERLTVRLSPSSLETLSIIAYKQPITRNEIEQIRGVEASGVMETLLERRLIKVVGRKETIGRPLLYGTTTDFLRHFGLKHLSELPDLSSLAATLTPSEPAASDAAPSEVSNDQAPEELPLEPAGVAAEGGSSEQEATAAQTDETSSNPNA